MFGDEKTLSNVQHILAKQQDERNSTIINADDLGAGLDLSLKYMMQFYSDTREVITGSEETSFSDTAGISGSSNEENVGKNDNENGLVNEPAASAAMVDSEISFLQLPVSTDWRLRYNYLMTVICVGFYFSSNIISFDFYTLHSENFQVDEAHHQSYKKNFTHLFKSYFQCTRRALRWNTDALDYQNCTELYCEQTSLYFLSYLHVPQFDLKSSWMKMLKCFI